MKCPNCGSILTPNAKYCTNCNNQVSDNQNDNNKKKKRYLRICVLSILSLLLVAGVVFGTYSFMNHRDAEKPKHRDRNEKVSKDEYRINVGNIDIVISKDDRVDRDTIVDSGGYITFIIDGTVTRDQAGDEVSRFQDGIVYYYEGKPDLETTVLKRIEIDSVCQMLAQRNSELLTEINKIKNKWKNGDIDDEQYNDLVKKAKAAQAANPNAHRVVVSIKPTANASYADVVRMLDEMHINQISTFQIEALSKQDSILYERKTGHPLGN